MPAARRGATSLIAAVMAAGALVGVAVTSPVATGATPAAHPAHAAHPAATIRYAVDEPLCSQPTDPTAARCFAMKQRIVPRRTPGAYRITARASAARVTTPAATPVAFDGTPAGLATAYRFDPKADRRAITVGIVLWHDAPNVLRDLDVFDRTNHLPAENGTRNPGSFRKVNARGKAAPLPRRDRGTAGEVALDTQAVRGVCNTCRILLVEADGPYDSDLAKAVDTAVRLGATIVTNSYGVPEHRLSAAFRNAYHHPGVAILASTGDAGWFGWDFANDPRYSGDGAASYPATSPDVIAVGGTSLLVDPVTKARRSETVWNNDGDADAHGQARARALGASGGGCSTLFTAPAWQRRTPGYAAAGCHGRRLAADVALVADPDTGYRVYDSYGSDGWITVGGTSLSSPIAAGMLALAGGPRGARFPATALYAATARPGSRYDVVSGGNGYCGGATMSACATATRDVANTNNPNKLGAGLQDCSFPRSGPHTETVPRSPRSECTATVGFDGPSGVGAPGSAALFARSDPYLGVTWNGRATHRRSKRFHATIATPVRGTTITSLHYGWGDAHRTITARRFANHTYRKPGRYTITLTSSDSRGQVVVVRKRITVR